MTYDVATDFACALQARGLPASATLADLIQHERGQAGMQAAFEFMGEMERAANGHEASGDTYAAEAIRSAVRNRSTVPDH